MKILTIVGARPQIIKAAALSRTIANHFSNNLVEVILHTGQHYDNNMSNVFFEELKIPIPNYTLSLKGTTPEEQMIEMEREINKVIHIETPDLVVVYGDTNSTYSGAKAAFESKIPLVHIEAGLRSWNNNMPEERNRVYADKVSTLLFTPTLAGYKNLINEGFQENNNPPYSVSNPKIYHCGDVMLDNSIFFSDLADKKSEVLKRFHLTPGKFILATVHRNTNTDHPEKLNAIINALIKIGQEQQVIFPVHPRTKKMMEQFLSIDSKKDLNNSKKIIVCEPVSFLDMISLEKNCDMIITDSGGVQKEAFYFKKPCVVLREETEWIELVECGAAILSGNSDSAKIFETFLRFKQNPPTIFPDFYGNGDAAKFVAKCILNNLS
ncbi:MAG: non-hydrolyzing UDP-N-acetylglucosamine 2-epimerase [Bacteroidota bacterium]|jgi:UDP-GlcNAc3NAcA epimerase